MSNLPSKSWALVEAARGARPSHADRARIRAGLDARLAVAAVVGVAAAGATAATAATAAASGGAAAAGASVAPGALIAGTKVGLFGLATKIFLACTVVGAVGLGARVMHDRQAAPAAASSPVAARAVESAAALAANAVRSSEAEAAPSDPGAAADPGEPSAPEAAEAAPSRGAAAPRRPRDSVSIAAEVKLLREAQAALKEGDAARSLSAIDTLAARHPDGALQEERAAARVLALCAAGRVDEARAEGRRFLAQNPKSVQAARVRASCASSPAPTKK